MLTGILSVTKIVPNLSVSAVTHAVAAIGSCSCAERQQEWSSARRQLFFRQRKMEASLATAHQLIGLFAAKSMSIDARKGTAMPVTPLETPAPSASKVPRKSLQHDGGRLGRDDVRAGQGALRASKEGVPPMSCTQPDDASFPARHAHELLARRPYVKPAFEHQVAFKRLLAPEGRVTPDR